MTVLKIYATNDPAQADFKVYFTTYAAEADILVYRVMRPNAVRRAGHWCFVKHPEEAEKCFYQVYQRFNCDLVVCYTDSKYEAGWKNPTMQYLLD